jgi:hypothetical protein
MMSCKSICKSFILALTLSLIAIGALYGQAQSYEDIVASLNSLTNEQAYTRLFHHQQQNPHFANTYIQLGNLSEKIVRELDPFRELHAVNKNIDNAVLYYELYYLYIQNNEVRKNKVVYANIPIEASGFATSNEGVLNYVKSRIEYCKALKTSLESTYAALEKSKTHYNNCVRIFNNISKNYENYNEVLLKGNTNFLGTLLELETEYNSTLEEFKAYKSLLKEIPLTGYNQNYELVPIRTFRLDGITNSDFLQQKFTLWNYGEWVNRYRRIYQDNIITLRSEIDSIQRQFDDNFDIINAMPSASSDFTLKSFDDLFLFRLGRFDSNSLVRELFNYQDNRQSFLLQAKNPLNNPTDSSSQMMLRKLRFYYRLAQNLTKSQQELENFRVAISPERIDRFEVFFQQYYHGQKGLIDYYNNQDVLLKSIFNSALNNLAIYLQNEEALKQTYPIAQGQKGVKIALQPADTCIASKNLSYVTEDVYYIEGLPAYVSGHINKSERKVPFVASISPNYEVKWIRELDTSSEADTKFTQISSKLVGYESGVLVIVTADNTIESDTLSPMGRLFANTLMHFNGEGEKIFSQKINSTSYPVYIRYDEINRLCHMAFGQMNDNDPNIFNNVTIVQADSLGSESWSLPLQVTGSFAGMVRGDNQFVAYLNYQDHAIEEAALAPSRGNTPGLLAVTISNEGRLLGFESYNSTESLYFNRVVSLSSNEINLLGNGVQHSDSNGALRYLVLSTSGEVLFSNMTFNEGE